MEDVVHSLIVGLTGFLVVDDREWVVSSDQAVSSFLHFEGCLPRLMDVSSWKISECRHIFANVVTVGIDLATEVDGTVEERRLLEVIAGRVPHPYACVDAGVGV